jgi:hypothetical protein
MKTKARLGPHGRHKIVLSAKHTCRMKKGGTKRGHYQLDLYAEITVFVAIL